MFMTIAFSFVINASNFTPQREMRSTGETTNTPQRVRRKRHSPEWWFLVSRPPSGQALAPPDQPKKDATFRSGFFGLVRREPDGGRVNFWCGRRPADLSQKEG
ncbi:hypothetical protein EWG81_23740 [Salmonella enterica subsp. enterica serovar Muenchen]|uniref:Uncharacterized protein n=1 Tax=Salmonella muenchen TaxID=596 RepID=A0A5V8MCR8_SALMU|nr:hypothetical protein [Salmonella enterica subsp. enterica serovar Muenchen]EAA7143755.1 hypothetical protein [Salmonella enterica subsp. enterica serovar Muenchen]EAB7453132.1 hypothetical protein [Salmonella enterica subsp. enterica serovar Muenchen]EAB8009924.1 hypothetical protein [Salmonella enterica subsp. enterica serovar Muenchen]EBS3038735.1 hypothetical protein [Salmonella enterica subsp. enterica serovar Muenchen]